MTGTLPEEVASAHGVYVSHLINCRQCWAPCKRYCDVGLGLKVEYYARFMMTLGDIHSRRRWLERENALNPCMADKLKARVINLFAERDQELP